jgi:hypothetical protein
MMIPSYVRKEVDHLLAMYETYKSCHEEQARAARALAKAKLRGEPAQDLEKDYKQLAQRLQSISDTMTFANPLVWAHYKFEAYADEAQPIRTMQDFRVHCSKPGYICTKRFTFINQSLRKQDLPTLGDTMAYADNQLLSEAFGVLHMLSQDELFMQAWRMHEYYRRDGVVAKWENLTI